MKQLDLKKKQGSMMELVTFYVGQALCGIDILNIQEINKNFNVTWVPQVPDYVLGIINLRGRIVTIIDLGERLGLSSVEKDKKNRNIIVDSQGEHIGFLVDDISDVIIADSEKIEPAPANIGGVHGKFFKGVLKTESSLVGVLNIDEVLKEEKA